MVINAIISDALGKYLAAYPKVNINRNHFLFFSSKCNGPIYTRSITRVQAWRIVAEMCSAVGLVGNYDTHTLRKTWGYHAQQYGVHLKLILAKLNHSNIAMTKHYLGITDDELQAIAEALNL